MGSYEPLFIFYYLKEMEGRVLRMLFERSVWTWEHFDQKFSLSEKRNRVIGPGNTWAYFVKMVDGVKLKCLWIEVIFVESKYGYHMFPNLGDKISWKFKSLWAGNSSW